MLSRKHKALNWLGAHWPSAYLFLRRSVRLLKKLMGKQTYSERRRDYNYYQEVLRLAEKYSSGGVRVIDVGGGEMPVVEDMHWMKQKAVLDILYQPPRPGVEVHVGDLFGFEPAELFDLVLCLQVLEHLHDPARFAERLFAMGSVVIISVPYRWPVDFEPNHVQDPIDEAKLALWTGREPVESVIISDEAERLIAVYRQDA